MDDSTQSSPMPSEEIKSAILSVTTGLQEGIPFVTGTHSEAGGMVTISQSEYDALQATTKAELCAALHDSVLEIERLREKLKARSSRERGDTERAADIVAVGMDAAIQELVDAGLAVDGELIAERWFAKVGIPSAFIDEAIANREHIEGEYVIRVPRTELDARLDALFQSDRLPPPMTSTLMCPKVLHDPDVGYLHAPDDDRPYDVDGQWYCGRCHCACDSAGQCQFCHGPDVKAEERRVDPNPEDACSSQTQNASAATAKPPAEPCGESPSNASVASASERTPTVATSAISGTKSSASADTANTSSTSRSSENQAAMGAAAPALPSADEIAWLIERQGTGIVCGCGHIGGVEDMDGCCHQHGHGRCFASDCRCLTFTPAGTPMWWTGGEGADPFTVNHAKALRFARQEDAERIIKNRGWRYVKAIEHMWCAAPALGDPK